MISNTRGIADEDVGVLEVAEMRGVIAKTRELDATLVVRHQPRPARRPRDDGVGLVLLGELQHLDRQQDAVDGQIAEVAFDDARMFLDIGLPATVPAHHRRLFDAPAVQRADEVHEEFLRPAVLAENVLVNPKRHVCPRLCHAA